MTSFFFTHSLKCLLQSCKQIKPANQIGIQGTTFVKLFIHFIVIFIFFSRQNSIMCKFVLFWITSFTANLTICIQTLFLLIFWFLQIYDSTVPSQMLLLLHSRMASYILHNPVSCLLRILREIIYFTLISISLVWPYVMNLNEWLIA